MGSAERDTLFARVDVASDPQIVALDAWGDVITGSVHIPRDRVDSSKAVMVVPGMVTLQRELQAPNKPCLVSLLVPVQLPVEHRALPPTSERIRRAREALLKLPVVVTTIGIFLRRAMKVDFRAVVVDPDATAFGHRGFFLTSDAPSPARVDLDALDGDALLFRRR